MFSQARLDRANRLDPVEENRPNAQRISRPDGRVV
jgi:hypothetical protein